MDEIERYLNDFDQKQSEESLQGAIRLLVGLLKDFLANPENNTQENVLQFYNERLSVFEATTEE